MLIQSHTGTIRVFPAIPASWKNVSFENLRTVGAFLVSSRRTNGSVANIHILSEKGAMCTIENPWESSRVRLVRNGQPDETLTGQTLTFHTKPHEQIDLIGHQPTN
jgi:alpha-L-fucosidase 2